MKTGPSVSSEEELQKLREEGKISEQEYEQLLEAIRTPPAPSRTESPPAEPQFQAFHKRILIGGFVICILGVIIGLIFNLPLVWGLGAIGIIVIPLKDRLVRRHQ